MQIYNNDNENENEKAYPQPLPKGGGGVTITKTMDKLTPGQIEALRSHARDYAQRIGVKSCDKDCSMCWMDRSDVPCPQRDIINAYIAGGEAILRMMEQK